MTPDADRAAERRFWRISRLVGWMPRRLARVFAWFRTRWVLTFTDMTRVREILADNVAPALPSGADPAAVADRLLRNYGMFLMDYFRIPAMTRRRLDGMFHPLVGEEHARGAIESGKGGILVTPHLGNWELGGIHMRLCGFPVTAVGVADPVNPALTRFRDAIRRLHGVEVVNIEPGLMTPILLARALEANRLVAMLGDRNFFESDPVEVTLFGRSAWFPRGPAILALMTGAPLIPAFITMGAGGRYNAELAPPIPAPQDGDRRERSDAMIRDLAVVFEARIRRSIDQWYVFDPYWGGAEPISTIARSRAGLGGGNITPLR